MSSLVVGGVAIPVAPGSGSWDWSDAVDRRRAFDNTYRASATGGAARDGRWTTPPVTRANAAIYRAALQKIDAQLCTGDLIEIPTMCCSELIDERPVKVQSGSYVSLDFALHEQQGKKLLLKYSPGDTITGESFTRSTVGYQINASGAPVSKAINVKRDGHFLGGVQSLLLEDTRANNLIKSNDFSNAAYAKLNMTVGTGIADPAGGTTACTLTATAGNAEAYQHASNGSSLIRDTAVWIKRRTGTGNVRILNADGTIAQIVTVTSSWARYTSTAAAASISRWGGVRLDTSGDAVDVWLCDNEDGAFTTSEIVTDTVAVPRGADLYSLPFTYPPQELSVYVKFVELGTALSGVGKRLFSITSAGGGAPHLLGYAPAGGFYRAYHDNGSANVFSTLAASPAIGDIVELVVRLFGDGSVDITQSINSAAATSATQSAANALATAWSGLLVWLNSGGSSDIGFTAIQSLKIVSGARSLSEMRAA